MFLFQSLVTLGYSLSATLQVRLDCKYINIFFLTTMAASMLCLGFSFLHPDTFGSYITLTSLVVAGASYGLGVGPVANVLMASLFPQKTKSLGVAFSKTAHLLVTFTQEAYTGEIIQ